MDIKEEKLCRLCYNYAENDFVVMDEVTRDMLEVLLLEVNLDISDSAIVCRNCWETVQKSYNFTLICNGIEEACSQDEAKFEETQSGGCRFCTNPQAGNDLTPMNVLINQPVFGDIWATIMSRMDLEVFKNVPICTPCKDNLLCYMKLVQNIKNGKVNMKNVHHFPYEDVAEYAKCTIKREVDIPDVIHFEPCNVLLKHEELEIKEEALPWDLNRCQTQQNTDVDLHGESCNINDEVKTNKGIMCLSGRLTHNNKLGVDTYRCTQCVYETKRKDNLKRHMVIHEDTSKIELYKCALCIYETKHKSQLKDHMLVHKNTSEVKMYKCAKCIYETKRKGSLRHHMLVHKDISKVKTYKCPSCNYKAIRKRNLRDHMLIHMDTSEVEIYECALCIFKTKFKRSLKVHMLIHKNASEIETYKCTMCSYESKQKGNLNRHMLNHDALKVQMYSCTLCIYQTKHKSQLKDHKLIHKDTSGIEMYKCALCIHETRRKRNLKDHMLTHKNASEIYMYKCTQCVYETRYKGSFTRHMLVHKDALEVEMHKCTLCSYATKEKGNLKRHSRTHKDP